MHYQSEQLIICPDFKIFMSGIIDDGLINYNNLSQNSLIQTPIPSHDHPQPFIHQSKEINQLLHAFLIQFNSDHLIETFTETSNCHIRLKIVFHDPILKGYTLMVSLVFNLQLSIIEICSSLMDESGPYQIETLDRRILFCKLFSKSCFDQQNKIIIDLHTGGLKIIRPTVLSFQENFTDVLKSKNKSENLHMIVSHAVKDSIFIFRVLFKELRKDSSFQTISRQRKQVELLKALNSYVIKCPIQPSFDASFSTTKYDKLSQKTKNEALRTIQMMNWIVTDLREFESHIFYTNPDFPLHRLKELYNKEFFESNQSEINFLKDRIIPPPVPVKPNASFESKYVFNIIQINQLFEINMKKINSGGFSDISTAEVEFWYLLTVSNQRMEKIQKLKKQETQKKISANKIQKLSRKQLVFKSNNGRGFEPGRNQIAHENKIVSKFKGLASVFLPEYFRVNNEKSPFSQYLVMEFFAYPTLNEYCALNQRSMSFLTKIHLASLVMQSLRFLSSYDIVHLDLKPSNIIVSKRMITKLIDFGQSYHKEMCQKNFKPAFSMPYGCPEIFDGIGKTEFNEKHDVYSWGVILFQMLFKRLPFFFSRQKATKVFKERAYLDYLYFVPQQEASYGACEIITLLRNVIFRAFNKDSRNRPSTIWLTVLLKECLSYLINLEFNKNIET